VRQPDTATKLVLYSICDSLERVVEDAYQSVYNDSINVFDQATKVDIALLYQDLEGTSLFYLSNSIVRPEGLATLSAYKQTNSKSI
jgi:hypothetical protein